MLRTVVAVSIIIVTAGFAPASAGSLAAPADNSGQKMQFQIQTATSDFQNAENVRSQAEKRLETMRKDLTRNWGG